MRKIKDLRSKIQGIRYLIILGLACVTFVLAGCAKPMAEGTFMSTKPIAKTMNSDANSIYYGIKWAFDETGLPLGEQDLAGGVVESKWVPVGAATHFVNVFDRKDFGANGAYYKMIITIIPVEGGVSRVEAHTKVQSIISRIESYGSKERDVLAKIENHARNYNVVVTNLGVED